MTAARSLGRASRNILRVWQAPSRPVRREPLVSGSDELQVQLDLDLLAERELPGAEGQVEVDAVVVALDLGRGGEADVAGAVGREDLTAVELDLERDRLGDAVDRE